MCLYWLSWKDVFLSKDGGVEKSRERYPRYVSASKHIQWWMFFQGPWTYPQFSAFLPDERYQLTNLFPARLPNSPWEHQDPRASLSLVLVFVFWSPNTNIRVKNVICQPGSLWLLTDRDQQIKNSYWVAGFNWEIRCFAVKSKDCSF